MQVGEVAASGIVMISPDAPKVLTNGHGRILMVISVLLVLGSVFAKNLRSLECLADWGFLTVLILVGVIMVRLSLTLSSPYPQNVYTLQGFSPQHDVLNGAVDVCAYRTELHVKS